ncbi:FAD-binding oxidoreductase [Falsiruegeria mediterranea]|jgi:FAD/FMN-containing dehydrogenase|nr:FAD-binding oxidoreductase [Falsiruegeria mediterranea]
MLEAKILDGGILALKQDALDMLGASLRGNVLVPGTSDYDEARTLWNSMVDRKPVFVIRALGASDVQKAVNFCRDNGLVMSIRSGGHQIAGHAVADGTVLLDLSHMRSVHVDAKAKVARVAPGALLGDVDRETQAHALAVPVGINSTTGIAGLTLGGGFGWTTRKWGMTIDNLLSAEIVTASGDILTTSASSHPDLFWAIRGGGGNFGIVTSFEFGLHDLGPEVLSGLIVHPIDAAPGLLSEFSKIADSAPDELTVWSVMRKAPPLPFLPEEWHGREVLIFAACFTGAIKDGEKAMAGLRSLGTPIADVISPHAFVDWQAAFDPLLTPGARNYWKSHDFDALPSDAIQALLDGIATLPDPACEVFIAHIGGAMARVAVNETAYPQRSSHFIMNVHTRWEDPAKDKDCIEWARALYDRMKPYSTGSAYVNFMPEDEERPVTSAYGDNGPRLSQIKGKYDPGNFFRLNHNILPT